MKEGDYPVLTFVIQSNRGGTGGAGGALSKAFRDLCILAIIICAAWVFQAFAGRSDTLMSSRRTLRRLVSELADRSVKVSYRTVWNFVHREKVSYKKSVFPAELLAGNPA